MSEALLAICLLLLLLAAWLAWRTAVLARRVEELPATMALGLEEKHRAMLTDLHQGLTHQADRVGAAQTEAAERLRAVVGEELRQTRDWVHALKLSQQFQRIEAADVEDKPELASVVRLADNPSGRKQP
ncbi:MAG: hypothetical protein ABIH03_14460 [Pseudomonadota bacterium]